MEKIDLIKAFCAGCAISLGYDEDSEYVQEYMLKDFDKWFAKHYSKSYTSETMSTAFINGDSSKAHSVTFEPLVRRLPKRKGT